MFRLRRIVLPEKDLLVKANLCIFENSLIVREQIADFTGVSLETSCFHSWRCSSHSYKNHSRGLFLIVILRERVGDNEESRVTWICCKYCRNSDIRVFGCVDLESEKRTE